jgi:hypothetical protein
MKCFAFAFVLLTACGDNIDPPRFDAAPETDGDVATSTRALVVAGDFQATGVLSELDVEGKHTSNNIAPTSAVGADPVLRKFGDELFVVNRIENNVTILDANDYSLIDQLDTGASSNPQDVAVDGDKLWIAAYGGKGIVEMTRGSATITEIDLSADDPDGKPNCASIYKVGGKLFVTCQLLDNTNQQLPPRGTSKVYVVDAATRAITNELDTTTVNPFSLLEKLPDDSLLVGTVDFRFGNNNAGCIERITTGATPTVTCVLDNSALGGGFASRMDVRATQVLDVSARLLVLVPRADFSGGDIRSIDLQNLGSSTLSVDPGVFNTEGQALNDLVVCPNGNVVAAENPPFGAPLNAPQGLRVYTGMNEESTNLALPIGLKPTSSHGLVCY